MKKISTSPERHSFQRDSYLKRVKESGKLESDPEVQEMIEFYNNISVEKTKRESDPNWQQNNFEYDLRTTDWILEKVRASDVYAQNLYAAMCNNDFKKGDARWGCSWRYAGGIISDMLQKGDYIDWYCSGIRNDGAPNDLFEIMYPNGYVSESIITDEIQEDVAKLGWEIIH